MQTQAHPQRLGKYQIVSILGRGGMGIVYKARDAVIDRVVAIKTISVDSAGVDQNHVERLLTEARSAGRLHHPNIVTVFDFGEENNITYIVLEYAEGVDLARMISEHSPLALPERIDIALQIAHGLAYAHDCGVVHRDIKPGNVRLTPKGIVKILDFGLARYDDTALTKSGYISGTIAYMSPERMNGQSGTSDDLFALGATVYEFLTGQRAFPGASAPEVMMKIMTGAPPPAPSTIAELPPQLDPVILRCLSRDAVDRYASAHDFAAALDEAFDESADFVASPERSEEFRAALAAGQTRRTRHDYSTLANETTTPVSPADAATQIVAEPLERTPTLTEVPRGNDNATLIARAPERRSRVGIAAAAAAVAIVLAGGAALLMRPKPGPTPKPVAVVGPPVSTAPATTSSAATEEVLAAPTKPNPLTTTTTAPKKQLEDRRPRLSTPVPAPAPAPAPVSIPTPTPTPVPVPPTIAPAPERIETPVVREDPRAEISTYIRRIAAAYTARDVSFFRENHLRYSDAMGEAIRRSPSTRVELNIASIDLTDASHARVSVERSDEFSGGAPPAKQRLVFVLERQNGAWRISRFERQ
jgi:serine/threonine-protein kinase